MVVLYHMPFPGKLEPLGATGVGIFFVLSGFLMSYLYARSHWDLNSIFCYGIARAARIAPVYWLVVSICIVISYAEPNGNFVLQIVGGQSIARHYLFGASTFIFWSIPPEIQYYIFFLVVWYAVACRAKQPGVLALLALLCAVLLLTHNLWPGLSLPKTLNLFLAGSIAGLVPRNIWTTCLEKRVLPYLQLAALALLLVPLWLYPSQPKLYEASELGLAIAVAVYLLSIPTRWTTFVFASPISRRIGRASFSIYLMHMLVFHFGARWLGLSRETYDPLWLALGLAGVVLPMIASRYVEIPLQRVTRRFLEAAILPLVSRLSGAFPSGRIAPVETTQR